MNEPGISGIITPLVTPMTENLEFDKHAIQRLIDHVVEGGVNGIILLGTNGECASLTNDIRHEAISVAVRAADGRVPVIVNISTSSYLESLQLARYACDEGADSLVLSPPFYFNMSQEELSRYIDKIASASSLPLFLYNAPQYTKTEIDPATVKELSGHGNIIGIKDSSGNLGYIKNLLNEKLSNGFTVMVGPEEFLGECVLLGCHGGVHGGSNMFPRLYVSMYRAAIRKDRDKMEELQNLIMRVHQQVYGMSDSPMSIIIGLKYVLSLKKICTPQMAMPVYRELTNGQKETMENLVKEFDSYGF